MKVMQRDKTFRALEIYDRFRRGEKLLKEKDINIRKLLEKDYLENRDIFSYSKTAGLQKAKRR